MDKRARYRAYAMVRAAKKKGTLVEEPCNACGEKAEAHHNDYANPLDVVWVCRKHHRLIDTTVVDENGVHERLRRKNQPLASLPVGRRQKYKPKTLGGKTLIVE